MKSQKRILSLFLCVFLCLFLITDVSFAAEENPGEIEITVPDTDAEEQVSEEEAPPVSEEFDVTENNPESEPNESAEIKNNEEIEEIIPDSVAQDIPSEQPQAEEAVIQTYSAAAVSSAASAKAAPQPAPTATAARAVTNTPAPASPAASASKSSAASRAAAAPSPVTPTVTCTPADGRQLSYNIVLKNATVPGGSTVKFAVWSEKNGQDDLIWYIAKKNGNNYTASVPIKSHKTAGKYEVHAYYQTAQGQLKGIKTGSFTVQGPSASKVTITRIDNNTGTFRVVVTNLTAPSGITEVKIPVWCSSDQSDIYWYTAVRHPNSNYWLIDCDISNHAYHMGTYQAHVYATDGNGIQTGVGTASAKIGGQKGTFSAKAANSTQTSFNLSLANATVPNGFKVKFAVWSNQNGQDDLIWYTAKKNGNTYTANVPISSHKSVGTYTVHTYLETPQGQSSGLGTGSFTVSGVSQKNISVPRIDKNAGTFTINVKTAAPAGIKEVRAAVWSASDQSDIHWYTLPRSGASYIAEANIANHKYNTGKYNVHAYATLNNGAEAFIGGITANITANQFIGVSKIANGEYKVLFRSAKPVKNVSIAVWSDANGQDDIVWYPALHEGGNTYSVIVNARNHLSPGAFTCHVYADNKYIGNTAFNLSAEEFGTEAERRLNAHVQSVYNAVGRDLYANYCWVKNTFTYSRRSGHITPPAGYTREQWYAVEGFEQHRGNCYTYAAAFYELAKGLGYNAQYVEGAVYGYGKWQPHGFVLIYLDGSTYICDPELEYASSRGRNLYMQPMSAPRATYRLWQ